MRFILCDRGRRGGPRSLPGACSLCGGRGCTFKCSQCSERLHVPNPPGTPAGEFKRRRDRALEIHRASHQLELFAGGPKR